MAATQRPDSSLAPRGKRRRWVGGIVLIAAVGIAAGALFQLWRTPDQIPSIDLTTADPAVVEAVNAALEEIRRSPRSADAWGKLAMLLFVHDFFADAELCFERAEDLHPGDPRWPYLRGLTLFKGDARPGEAIACLGRAVERCGDEPTPRLRLGEALIEQGRIEAAEQLFREVIEKDGLNARAHLGLGRVHHRKGDDKTAMEHLNFSLRQAPSVKMTRALLVEIHFRRGDHPAASLEQSRMSRLPDEYHWPDPYFAAVRKHFVGVWSNIEWANYAFGQGKRPEAIALLEKTVARYPDALMPHLVLGQLQERAGFASKAEEVLRRATRMSPDSVEAHSELGMVLARRGKHAAAVEHLRHAVRIKPDFALARFHLGQSLLRVGDRAGALDAFREVVRYRPGHAEWQRTLGQLLAGAGQYREARTHLRHAVRLNPADVRARELLTSVEEKLAAE